MLAETPPIWQIALSMGINISAIAGARLARRTRLPRRHADVWQTSDHPGGLEMDQAEISGDLEAALTDQAERTG